MCGIVGCILKNNDKNSKNKDISYFDYNYKFNLNNIAKIPKKV